MLGFSLSYIYTGFHTLDKSELLTNWDLGVDFKAVYFVIISESKLKQFCEDDGVGLAGIERNSRHYEHRSIFVTKQRGREI